MQVNGKTALVTGGSDGIGLEIARQLQAKGAHIIVCGRREDLLIAARSDGMEALQADLSNAAGCEALVNALDERPLDILVNNAGMSGNFGPGEPVDLALTDKAIFLNLNAPMHLIGGLLPGMMKRPEAAIVNVTSGLAIAPRAGGPVYCASKAGLRSFTQSLRHNLRDTNVHVIEALPPGSRHRDDARPGWRQQDVREGLRGANRRCDRKQCQGSQRRDGEAAADGVFNLARAGTADHDQILKISIRPH